MDITITLSDEAVEELAAAIATRLGTTTAAEEAEAEADDFGAGEETTKEITLTDMQDAIKEAVGAHGKEKIKALVKKTAGVDKVVDIDKAKYQAVLDALKKVKK